MTEKGPLLSICIPTYNREKYLKILLDSIVHQKEFLDTNDVEIVVDDGPSEDNTEFMVKDYINKYGDKIKYYRNTVRIGMCPAFLEALHLGTGKYLWLMGSDDSLDSNALKIVLNIINVKKPSIMLSKRYSDNDNASYIMDKEISIVNINGFPDFLNELLKQNNKKDNDVFFTFISVWCFNREFFKKSYKELIKNNIKEIYLKQHYFNFSFIGFSNISQNDTIVVINTPRLVHVNSFDVNWKPNAKIGNDLKQEMKFFMEKYHLNSKQEKLLSNIYRPWNFMCLLYPLRKFLDKLGLLKFYNFISYIYRRIRGYV